MTTPISLTEDQCYEAIERWQDYARFMYHTERGVGLFESNITEHCGQHVSISIEPDGRFAATRKEDGVKAIYDVIVTTSPTRERYDLDNVTYSARIANPETLSAEDQTFFRDFRLFPLSAFQRTIFNQFLGRMEPVTMRIIARDLSLITPKQP